MVDPGFTWFARVLAIPAIVEDENVVAEQVELLNRRQAMGNVPCVAVKKKNGFCRLLVRDVPVPPRNVIRAVLVHRIFASSDSAGSASRHDTHVYQPSRIGCRLNEYPLERA